MWFFFLLLECWEYIGLFLCLALVDFKYVILGFYICIRSIIFFELFCYILEDCFKGYYKCIFEYFYLYYKMKTFCG